MILLEPNLAAPLQAFATSLGIGLLIGIERERQRDATAGLRTFALVAMLGCLFALLGEKTGTPWFIVVGLIAITITMVAANFTGVQESYPGFTSEIAVITCYGLGAAVWHGYGTLAVMLAITTTILLYFKAQLKRITEAMTPKDMHSILQFAVLSFVVLPILPNSDFGPYSALNPRQDLVDGRPHFRSGSGRLPCAAYRRRPARRGGPRHLWRTGVEHGDDHDVLASRRRAPWTWCAWRRSSS